MDDPGLDVALFRYRIIAPLLDEDLQPSQREQIIREITAKGYRIPNSSRTSVSRATVYRWFNAYKRDRLDGLRPKQRKDAGSCRAIPQHLLDKAIEARREAPYRSARKIVDILKATEQEVPPIALSTLHRHFQLAGCTRQELERAGKTWIRFQREHPNDLCSELLVGGDR